MRTSFIGCSAAAVNTAVFLKKKGFDVQFVYDDNIQSAVDAAIEINCKVSTGMTETIEKSELIFIGAENEKMRKTLYKLNRLRTKGKIFCIISDTQNSDMLEMSETVFSLFPLKHHINGEIADLTDVLFVVEGSGVRYWDFIDELDNAGIKYAIADVYRKSAYVLTVEYATELSNALLSTIDDILTKANIYDKSFLKNVVLDNVNNYFKTPKDLSYFDMPVSKGDIAKISKHFEAIELFGSQKAKSIYKILAFSILENSNLSKTEKSRVERIILDK